MKMWSLLPAILLPALTLFGCASPPADPAPAPVAAPVVSPAPAVKPDPMAVLKQMARYLRSLDRFTVRVERTMELILPTDQRLHADQTLEIAIQKPNRLRVNFQSLSGGRQLFYDGANFSLYTPEAKVYASAAAAPTIDETLDLLAAQYQIFLPVADVLVADPDSRLAQNITLATYVGRILIQGVPCHHLAFRTPEVDWQIWIEDGAQPLPRRLLLTDKSAEGSPQMMANLTRWDLAPTFPADFFTFRPPQDAQKIPFLDQVRAVRPAKAAQ